MPETFAGIVRVSHVGGRGGDSFHADREQVEDLEAHVAKVGARLVLLPPELNVSGGGMLEQRPSLLAAIEGVERGEFDGIIVSYLSRLGRNTREQLRAWDRVEAAGGRIIVVRENVDTSTPTGRFMRTFLLANAERELEEHRERFDQRRMRATAAGVWQRRQTPLGYRRDPETRRLVPDENADIVRRAFGKAPTSTMLALAGELGMTASGARHLLRNRVYLGELRVGKYVNPSAHEPLVDVDTFEAAQVDRVRPGRRGHDGVPSLLAGLARCGSCGHVMSRSRTARVIYTCHGHHSGGRCPGPAAVTADLLDALVERVALAELERLRITATASDGSAQVRTRLVDAERELATYLTAVSASDVGAEAFRGGAQARQQAVEEARDALRRHLAASPVPPGVESGAEAWEALDGHGRNALLRGLLEAVIVRRAGGRGARTPLGERVRVIAHGAGLVPPLSRGGGKARGCVMLPFPDLDDERVLRVPGAEDPLEGAGGAEQV